MIAAIRTMREKSSKTVKLVRRVMVVDDNTDAAETLVELLNVHGYEAKALHDGPSTLDEARRFRPDALLIDIGLPAMDGYEVAQKLRQIPEASSAHLIAVTGYGQDSHRQRAEDAGFDAYLVKPIDLNKLFTLLEAEQSG